MVCVGFEMAETSWPWLNKVLSNQNSSNFNNNNSRKLFHLTKFEKSRDFSKHEDYEFYQNLCLYIHTGFKFRSNVIINWTGIKQKIV